MTKSFGGPNESENKKGIIVAKNIPILMDIMLKSKAEKDGFF